MKILLFGNIGSGKTTIAKKLVGLLPEFQYIAIDEIRRKMGDGSEEKEKEIREFFVENVANNKISQIVECLGIGEVGNKLREMIDDADTHILIILLSVSAKTCIERITDRIWDVPFPRKQDNIKEFIEYADFIFRVGDIPMKWSEYENVTFLQTPNENIKQQKFIINIIKMFVEMNSHLVDS